MAAKLQCEICGGKLIGKPGGIFECDSCGVEYSTEWAKEKIQEITGIPMPEQVKKLRDLPVRHTAACDRDKMGQAVLDVMA